MFACTKVARDEKDGDLWRLLRHVTNRAKLSRRQRSKSAHGHLQSVQNERSIDDAVATAAAAGKLKLSNDELHTTSSPDLDKRRGFLSLLRGEQKDKDGPPSLNTQMEHVRRSPALPRHVVSPNLDRGRPRNVQPLVLVQPPHKTAASPLSAAMRSYCGAAARTDSVLLFPGHSRDILLKQSRDRVASTSSNSGGLLSSSATRPDETGALDGSAAAYLGSNADGHSPVMRRVVMRNRATNMLRCWQRPESASATEQATLFDLENRPLLSLQPDPTVDVESEVQESSTDFSPSYLSVTSQVPFLEFKKVDYSQEMSPLSLSVQCGSDSDDFESAHESVVVPRHPLTSKRVWNVRTGSWEDAAGQRCNPETANSCDLSLQSRSRDPGNIVFTKADTGVKSSLPVHGDRSLLLAKSCSNRCSFSENDIHSAESRLRGRDNVAVIHQPAVQTVRRKDVEASSKCPGHGDHVERTRHSVIGGCYDINLVSSIFQQTIQSFCRAKSCPEVTAFSLILPPRCVHTSDTVRRRRNVSRCVSNGRQTAPKSSVRRRRSNRVTHRRQLAPPLFASWPGKGDVKGSMLAYESSV